LETVDAGPVPERSQFKCGKTSVLAPSHPTASSGNPGTRSRQRRPQKRANDERYPDGHPIIISRPIVVMPKGVRLCRSSEVALEILPNLEIGRFVKEDGEVVEAPDLKA